MVKHSVNFLPVNVKDGEGVLQMRVRWKGQMISLNLGYAIDTDKWDDEIQRCRNNTTHGRKKVSAAVINGTIREYRAAVEDAIGNFPGAANCPDRDKLRSLIETNLGRIPEDEKRGRQDAMKAFHQFIIRESKLRSWSDGTCRIFRSTASTLKEWRDPLRFSDFDKAGLESLLMFLEESRKNITTMGLLTRVHSFLSWAEGDGYDVPDAYRTFRPRIKNTQKTVVWLSPEEVMMFYRFDGWASLCRTGNDNPRVIRDMFCLSCFTGMRASDIIALKAESIRDRKIYLSIQKTSKSVAIELNRYALEIIGRYMKPGADRIFPEVETTIMSKVVKKIARQLKIDSPIETRYYVGRELRTKVSPKYEAVCFHTGRKSFVCNALSKGISPTVVMQWTGHSDYKSMLPYIAITDKAKENAMMMIYD